METTHRHGHGLNGGPPIGDGNATRRRLGVILALTLAFMIVEAGGGLLSGSLALLADAGHMLSDASAITLSLLAIWLADRDPSARHTFGFRRAEFLAAFVNAIGLVVLAGWIVMEALERIGTPRPVLGGIMFWVALAGLAVNLTSIVLLRGRTGDNLNLRSALWHICGDLMGSLGAVTAAVVIHFTGFTLIDPLLSVAIAVLIGTAGVRILYDSAALLMDRVPERIDTGEVRRFLTDHPDVLQICDLHIWGVSSRDTMLTAHLVVRPEIDRDGLLHRLLPVLQQRFGLGHMTVQLETEPSSTCPQL